MPGPDIRPGLPRRKQENGPEEIPRAVFSSALRKRDGQAALPNDCTANEKRLLIGASACSATLKEVSAT